ncbi:hypothetical protein B0H21DRAFT_747720 [Amylocystis lapponica]|nr:hypothetical protein B0H21DRAFT_747720 [Amylocystis lapponica]
MVVTRRAPAPPVPTSRTNSSQPVPRSTARPPFGAIPEASSLLSNGRSGAPVEHRLDRRNDSGNGYPSKPGGKWKGKHKRGKKARSRSSGFVEFLMRVLVLCFTIYTFALKSPVCRGLEAYRQLVIEPYILPSIQYALTHPSVAPYVEKARPYAERVVTTSKPIIQRTRTELNTRVIPQWNARVVPMWNSYAIPQLHRLDAQIAPYRHRVTDEYERRLAPVLRNTAYTLRQLQYKARPYIVVAAHKTYDGYHMVRPYARPLWERVLAVLARIVAMLSAQRRQFVDPHVKQIWERVKELSRGKPDVDVRETVSVPVLSVTGEVISVTQSIPVAVEPATGLTSSAAASSISSAESAPSSASSAVGAAASSVAESLASSASASAASVSDTAVAAAPSITRQHDALAVSLADAATDATSYAVASPPSTESAGSAPSAGISSAADLLSASSVPASEVFSDPSSPVSHPPDAASSSAAAEPSAPRADDDIDLDAFYAELGLDDDAEVPATPSAAPAPPPADPEATKEAMRLAREAHEAQVLQRAERTAHKRADVEARHGEWEIQLSTAIEKKQKALRKALVALRKDAVAELKSSREIREEVDSLVDEADKFCVAPIVGRVVQKIDDKFADRLRQTEAVVNGWYMQVLNKELAEVNKLTAEVKDIADRAQSDIAFDYAYMDDVTYLDWQRYHDLIRASESFTAVAQSIQNGSHPSPPTNPVLPAITDLQSEVQDIVVGFETRLRRVKRNGERSFSGDGHEAATELDDAPGDETVSILPIEDDSAVRSPADLYVPPVVIGRSKEEVMDALNRAVEQDGDATSPANARDQPQESESAVHELVEDVVGENDAEEHAPLVHEEL